MLSNSLATRFGDKVKKSDIATQLENYTIEINTESKIQTIVDLSKLM
jgi:hypothetical protein